MRKPVLSVLKVWSGQKWTGSANPGPRDRNTWVVDELIPCLPGPPKQKFKWHSPFLTIVATLTWVQWHFLFIFLLVFQEWQQRHWGRWQLVGGDEGWRSQSARGHVLLTPAHVLLLLLLHTDALLLLHHLLLLHLLLLLHPLLLLLYPHPHLLLILILLVHVEQHPYLLGLWGQLQQLWWQLRASVQGLL